MKIETLKEREARKRDYVCYVLTKSHGANENIIIKQAEEKFEAENKNE